MPRTVTQVATRARRKNILGLNRCYFESGKNVGKVAKKHWERGLT